MKYEMNKNESFNSIELTFDGKPSEAVRDALKALRFRWHGVKKIWYGYSDEETVRTAIENAENGTVKAVKRADKVAKADKVNKYGIKVGDVFYMNWGYDQTNVDFFQVVELVGECSVRVCDVAPQIVNEDGIGFMSCNRTYNITAEPMPKAPNSVHIKDNVKGDLKRVCKSGDTLYLNMTSYANAYKIEHGMRKEYVSWYA